MRNQRKIYKPPEDTRDKPSKVLLTTHGPDTTFNCDVCGSDLDTDAHCHKCYPY